ncbi:MAG: right-handed parallel beta-helix repeat-containing protein, partial [candidate division Zixibacteria bacterium]
VVLCLIMAGTTYCEKLHVRQGSDLQSVIDYAKSGDTLILAIKSFTAEPKAFADPLCGNCLDPLDGANASVGFVVKDKALTIIGQDRTGSKLITKAGYGLYFENSFGSELKNLTVTGGIRDVDGDATDAAVVVRNSRLLISGCNLSDNDHRIDSVVVGIGGVFGREGADITIHDCRIVNNAWDGIALYRGATAKVTDCFISQGRGAGIGVTWDATCVAYRNEVTGFWKGIGSFGTSVLVARNNLVHNNLGWGLIATGRSFADFANNVVVHNGNCGVAPWSTECHGRIKNNIIVDNGWREQWVCPCVGVWNYGDWAKWDFSNNIVYNNEAGNYEDIWDQTDLNGNISVDPMFIGENNYHLRPDSPARHAGDSAIYNIDGSVSDIGLYGGPQAKQP